PRQRRVLQFELAYAPIILHLNFSPISWLRHHGFPLEESELGNLMRLDPFAAGSLAIFDFQYGAPEKYPRLVAIPFKGLWAPKKEAVESKLIRLFKTAQFDYRQTDRGYRWREWELVPVDGGLFIGRDQQMLDEALETYTEPTGWTLLNGHQEEFFKDHPLAVHFSLSKAAKQNKLRSNSTLPTELSVGLSVQEGEWTAVLRSNLKGSKDISETLSLYLNREPPKQRTKLHPIANNILTIASEAERTRNLPDHLTHAEILEKGWINSKKGEYYVQMHFSLPQVHYCSTDKNNEMVHYTWSDGILYKNPLPCR
ncbi:MAG: hypothetical protein VX278_08000, partial [Myxococcota bacterium]|nr:hypothetical protein [Myxococcota bacterium]